MNDKKLAVTALIYNEEGDVLGVSRKNDPNDFGLPGGKVESGETLEEALIREIKEETGLTITWMRPFFEREDGEYVSTTFIVNYTGNIHTAESGNVKWTNFEELKKGTFGEYNAMLERHCRVFPKYVEGDWLYNPETYELFCIDTVIHKTENKNSSIPYYPLKDVHYAVSAPHSEHELVLINARAFEIRMDVIDKNGSDYFLSRALKDMMSLEKNANGLFACGSHLDCNQYFTDDGKTYMYMYSFHLAGVRRIGKKFKHLIDPMDWQLVEDGLWNHDVIEDARRTPNDVANECGEGVAKIAFALTNEKGWTRKDRANAKYYADMRNVQYAIFGKLCDRIFNVLMSKKTKSSMFEKYKKEHANFKNELYQENDIYQEMWNYLDEIFAK